jgi:hypothetical protein
MQMSTPSCRNMILSPDASLDTRAITTLLCAGIAAASKLVSCTGFEDKARTSFPKTALEGIASLIASAIIAGLI